MKKILTLAAGFLATITFGQCTIAGNSSIKLNETATFSLDSKAQCEECYSWKSSNEQNLKIDGNNKTNKITVQAISLGKSTVSVSVLTSQGPQQCEKIIDVLDTKQNSVESSCGIQIDDFKDVKVTESVISFFPNENSSDYNYKWTVTYVNGDVQESTEKIPQFFFSEINYITTVKVKISTKSPICSITLTKKFEQNYWKPTNTKLGVIEQKVYSQGSYSEYVKSDDKKKNDINNINQK